MHVLEESKCVEYINVSIPGQPQADGAWSPWILKNSLVLSTGTFIPSGMVVDFKFWVYFFFYPEESDGSMLREILIVNY